jgi:3-phosphoglycerate kinase
MQTIDNFNFAGKKAFVRVDFNVPLDENFVITDDNRIRAALPTLKKILADGGSPIIGSHLGRPKGVTEKYSLKHILSHVSELLGKINTIEFPAFMVYLRLRRVDILHLHVLGGSAQYTSAKSYHFSRQGVYGENDTPPETVAK